MLAADQASVAVLYASAYGNTAALAQAISRGITKAGNAHVPFCRHSCTIAAPLSRQQFDHFSASCAFPLLTSR
jgi:hypothetical protein